MHRTARPIPFVATALAAALAAFSAAPAHAQRAHPVAAQGVEPTPSAQRGGTPYPGASVYVEPGWFDRPAAPGVPSGPLRRGHAPAVVYYYPYPVAVGYPTYQPGGQGGGVYDTNGRPLSSGFDTPVVRQYEGPLGTPDLSGAPYVAVEGGAMLVDFGNGDRRTFASCAAVAAAATPDGQSRTVFYRPPVDGLVLRPGQRGHVIGAPPAGARSCYQLDRYGRTVLSY